VESDDNACEISENTTLSIAEVIKLALAHDLGANHLEEFENCPTLDYTSKSFHEDFTSVENEKTRVSSSVINEEKQAYSVTEHSSKYLLHAIQLRGPPGYS